MKTLGLVFVGCPMPGLTIGEQLRLRCSSLAVDNMTLGAESGQVVELNFLLQYVLKGNFFI